MKCRMIAFRQLLQFVSVSSVGAIPGRANRGRAGLVGADPPRAAQDFPTKQSALRSRPFFNRCARGLKFGQGYAQGLGKRPRSRARPSEIQTRVGETLGGLV